MRVDGKGIFCCTYSARVFKRCETRNLFLLGPGKTGVSIKNQPPKHYQNKKKSGLFCGATCCCRQRNQPHKTNRLIIINLTSPLKEISLKQLLSRNETKRCIFKCDWRGRREKGFPSPSTKSLPWFVLFEIVRGRLGCEPHKNTKTEKKQNRLKELGNDTKKKQTDCSQTRGRERAPEKRLIEKRIRF